MRFTINNTNWDILEVEAQELKADYIKENPKDDVERIYIYGRTNYLKHTIKINKELCEEERVRTLKHELCHCWMWNTANANQENYNEEHICEIIACSNEFIYEICERYKKEVLKMACGGKKKGNGRRK